MTRTLQVLDTEGHSEVAETFGVVGLQWETPGLWLAERILGQNGVSKVAERFDVGKYLVFVVLSEDDEKTLDFIFDREREMYAVFKSLPFDVRVIAVGGACDEEGILAACITHYARAA